MSWHRLATGTTLHYPKGSSFAGIALDLEDGSATSMHWTDEAGTSDVLVVSLTDRTVVWGDSTLGLAYGWKMAKAAVVGLVVEDTDGTDYLKVSTSTGSERITLGNATTNPGLSWLGTGAWTVGGGAGSAGQVLQSNGSSAAPSWASMTDAASSSGTTSDDYEINSDAVAMGVSSGSLTITTGSGIGDLYRTKLTNSGGSLIVSTTNNGTAIGPSVYLGLNSTSAASQSALTFSAANGGTQRTISATWVASTQVLTVAGGVVSLSSAPTAPGGSSSERWGASAAAPGANCGAFGYGAVAGLSSSGDNSTAVGTLANAGAARATVIGEAADGQYADTFVGGQSAAATAAGAVVIGRASSGGASVVLNGSDGGTSGRFVVGRATGPTCPISEVLIGRGDLADTTATTLTWRTTNATGTNINGTDQTWDGSRGTGTGTGGYMRWRVSVPGASGSTLGTLTEIMRLDGGAAGGTGKIGFFNKAATPAVQQATPVTLADVIALLQAYGLSV